ncbi:MAG: acylphosphatase [Anaerolineae bacterium]|jgi:acylphosphatase
MKQEKPAQRRLEAVVQGRVQGVSFRFYTQRRAMELGLTGYVRNRWDGTVQVIAEGQQAELEDLLAFLRVGPRAALVTEVNIRWTAPSSEFERFEVRY